MKPWLPLSWYSLAIVPKHDGLTGSNLLTTHGVLNNIQPQHPACQDQQGIMLLGGSSKHYQWSTGSIVQQVHDLALQRPEVCWQVCDSRRSPEQLLTEINQLGLSNLTTRSHQQTSASQIGDLLNNCQYAVVSPDSVSMLYESFTAGCRVAVFELKPARKGRVMRGVEQLLAEQRIAPLAGLWQQPRATLWEADRAAEWLLGKLNFQPQQGS